MLPVLEIRAAIPVATGSRALVVLGFRLELLRSLIPGLVILYAPSRCWFLQPA